MAAARQEWKQYDPSWLVRLAQEQHPNIGWLPNALARCVRCREESRAYIHFLDPANANSPGSDWQFDKNLLLEDEKEGTIVLDILQGQQIGGIEFLGRL